MRLPARTAVFSLIATRRVGRSLTFSFAVLVILLAASSAAYGVPSLTLGLGTPVTYLIGPLLGCVAATAVSSVAPEMEALSTDRVGVARAGVVAGLALSQLGMLWVTAALLPVDVRLALLLTATVAFQGIGVVSAVLVQGPAMWVLPFLAITPMVLFGYSPQGDLRPWNLLLVDSTAGRLAAVALCVAGLVFVRFVRPGLLHRLVS